MKDQPRLFPPDTREKGLPDYYITPTHDFTQYTKDCEAKYWAKATEFDWEQCVEGNLCEHLEHLDPEAFSKVMGMVVPVISVNLQRSIVQVQRRGLPANEDALKDIGEFIPSDKNVMREALNIQAPLKDLHAAIVKANDEIEILDSERLDMRELQRLGFRRTESGVKNVGSDAERREQGDALTQLEQRISKARAALQQLKKQHLSESKRVNLDIRKKLDALQPEVLSELAASGKLLDQIGQTGKIPSNANDLARLKDLMLKRQLHSLKDIANHALVVEQCAIAPLSTGIIHYKRHREIQEALTTFITDEAKHSATFRRYLVEKLEAKEYISEKLIKGANQYMWLARFMPGAGLFLAVMVETIGAAYLEFFGTEAYMPEKLFRKICWTISEQDERRHVNLCVELYNELFRKGYRWERMRNGFVLNVMMKAVYGDRSDDHHLVQAMRTFGIEADVLYGHIVKRLCEELARVRMFVKPERLMAIIGR